jgi:predicted ribosome quality control (RQC) complex YloA/Tae2 family protein
MINLKIHVDENDKEYNILIGQSQKENDDIIRSSTQNDTWFHLDKISGPHIIFQNNGDKIPKRYFNQIAGMFPEYKSKLPNRYSVIYTELKNVKLTTTPGQVNVSNTKIIKM